MINTFYKTDDAISDDNTLVTLINYDNDEDDVIDVRQTMEKLITDSIKLF